MGGGGFASDPMLPEHSATYGCEVVVGEYVYGICRSNLHNPGQSAKVQGGLTAFRAKRTLRWFTSWSFGLKEGEPFAVLPQGCCHLSSVIPGGAWVGRKHRQRKVVKSQEKWSQSNLSTFDSHLSHFCYIWQASLCSDYALLLCCRDCRTSRLHCGCCVSCT